MIIPAVRLLELFRAVKSDKHQSEDKSMVIFAANGDVDSVCSTAQLESILGKADMPSTIMPVESYMGISEYCEALQLHGGEELRTVFMINCGATEDIRVSCRLNETVRVIILDSHRPVWHGYNTEDENTVVVVDDDDPVPPQDVPEYIEEEDYADEGGRDADDLSSEEESEEEEEEAEEDREASPSGQQEQGEREGAGGRGERKRPLADGGERAEKRARKQRRVQRRQQMTEHNKALGEYYDHKAGYGKPTSLLLFNLAHSQQEDDNFHVWLGILGITDQYVHQRMDPAQYNKWRADMELHVQRHNNTNTLWGGDQEAAEGGLYNNPATHQLTVSVVKDLKIPLLRYWSLYEALQYTHHIATRMQTWREVGQAQLNLFLADLNIPVSQSHASYMSMHPEVMRHMESKLESSTSKFRIAYDALRYKGFEMRYKNDMRILATDYVHALTAVLGQPRTEGKTAKAIFSEAIDCLYPQRSAGWAALRRGMDSAKQLAQAVVQEGGLVITRGQVQGGKQAGVWICDLSELTLQNATLLQHPNSLVRLAFFLRDARAQRFNHSQSLVVVGPMSESGMCYVVAIRSRFLAGVMQNNPFSQPFKEVLQDLGTGEGASTPTFDNAVFLLKRSAVGTFLEELKLKVQEARAGANA